MTDDPELLRRQELELRHWRESVHERPGSDSIHTIVNKFGDSLVLLDLLARFASTFERARTIVELGAGQGWVSCIVKRGYPDARVTATYISSDALASLPQWERIFDVKDDDAKACRSYATGLPDASVDLVFCFASAHHFVAHRRTLAEIERILAPDGVGLYLYEMACRPLLRAFAARRLNKKRPHVPEDVLVYDRIASLSRDVGLECRLDFYPILLRRGPLQTLYYAVLNSVPPLQRLLPCTMNFHFTRRAG